MYELFSGDFRVRQSIDEGDRVFRYFKVCILLSFRPRVGFGKEVVEE